MTPEEAKGVIGKRILYKIWLGGRSPYETVVKEVSPSGEWVKLRHCNGFVGWEECSSITLVEVLPG